MKLKILLFLFCLTAQAKILDVPRIEQETDSWCWLASSAMVNTYHGVCILGKEPDMQCSTIHYMATSGKLPPRCLYDCLSCNYGLYDMKNINIPLDKYSKESSLNCGHSVTSVLSNESATIEQLKREIDNNRPLMAGINPSLHGKKSIPEHMVVIIGYTDADYTVKSDTVRDKVFLVRVNDPISNYFSDPYRAVGATKIDTGVYDVPYEELVKSLAWQTTIFVTPNID